MRSSGRPWSYAILVATLAAAVGCAAPPAGVDGNGADPPKKSDGNPTGATNDESTSAPSGDRDTNGAAPKSPPASTTAPPKFACSGAGIAAYADALVKATRTSCTSDGIGVVRNDNYQCVKGAIDSVAPAHPDTSYNIVTTLLAPNQEYPNLECTYFIQMVTSGVCGTPLSPSDMAWTAYPLAKEFIGKAPAGWTWFPNNGAAQVEVGDIFVYSAIGGAQDPGHIMIVAEITGTQFRIAEANELNSNGSPATAETGVMSNTRLTTINDPQRRPAGWFRLTPQ